MKEKQNRTMPRVMLAWWLLCACWWGLLQTGCNCGGVVAPGGVPTPPSNRNITKDTKPPCLEVKPVDFGGLPIRCIDPLTQEVEIKHLGLPHCPKVISIKSAQLNAAGSTAFQLNGPGFPVSVSAGQTVRMNMGFKATALGPTKTSLEMTTDAPQQETMNVDIQGTGVTDQTGLDKYKQDALASDILFVIDNSCSMREEQYNLSTNFESFILWAKKLKADYQIGVISTNAKGTLAGCLIGPAGKKILKPNTPDLARAFADNAELGTNGNFLETGLHAAYLALHHPKVTGCNNGFLRTNAVLSLIFISDERDQSPQDVSFYERVFKRLKGEGKEHMVRASAVVGPAQVGCTSAHGNAEAAPRYIDAAARLGGVNASICTDNWSENLKAIGLASIISRFHFPLTKPAQVDSLFVTVDGKTIPLNEQNGWAYDKESNRITFQGTSIPAPGANIEIKYLVRCPEPEVP